MFSWNTGFLPTRWENTPIIEEIHSNLLIRTKMQYAKGMNTRMTSEHKLTAYGGDLVHNTQLYTSAVGHT